MVEEAVWASVSPWASYPSSFKIKQSPKQCNSSESGRLGRKCTLRLAQEAGQGTPSKCLK